MPGWAKTGALVSLAASLSPSRVALIFPSEFHGNFQTVSPLVELVRSPGFDGWFRRSVSEFVLDEMAIRAPLPRYASTAMEHIESRVFIPFFDTAN